MRTSCVVLFSLKVVFFRKDISSIKLDEIISFHRRSARQNNCLIGEDAARLIARENRDAATSLEVDDTKRKHLL